MTPRIMASRGSQETVEEQKIEDNTRIETRSTTNTSTDQSAWTKNEVESQDQPVTKKEGLSRTETTLIFLTNQIGLGVLSLPLALQTLGIIPGIIAIVGLGILCGYTAFVLLQFYKRYPDIVNIADVGKKIGGRWLGVFVGVTFWVNLCMCAASCLITLSIALNSISEHSMCTVGFIGIVTVVSFLLCVPRGMGFIAKIGIPATISIIAAILLVMISLGIKGPQNAPEGFTKKIVLIGNPTFTEGMIAILNICFAYAGNQAYVTIMAEMRDPLVDFMPALYYLQAFSIIVYSVVAAILYAFAAQFTTSPALGSAPKLVAKVAYGIVIPCVLGGAMVFGNSATKYAFVSTLRILGVQGSELSHHGKGSTRRSWVIWLVQGVIFWILAFVLANSIPVFNSILSIASALFVALFTFGISAAAWLHLNKGRYVKGWKKTSLTVLNIVIIAIMLMMNTGGMYAAIVELLDIFKDPKIAISGAFSCADNGIFKKELPPAGADVLRRWVGC